jgi:hypothetical protein
MHALIIASFLSLSFYSVTALPAPMQNTTTLATATETEECNLSNLRDIIFNRSLNEFDELFKSPNRPKCYHWCTNACSWSPDYFPYDLEGNRVSWKPACARHDFSWHNLKRYGAFDEENKRKSDEQLRDGMVELCGEHEVCTAISRNVYYPAVRIAATPASQHATWEPNKKTECTVFPGCCSNYSDPNKCGPPNWLGQSTGDLSCVAQ